MLCAGAGGDAAGGSGSPQRGHWSPAPEQPKPGEPRHRACCGGGDPGGSRGSRRAGGRRGPAEMCLAWPSGAGGQAGLRPCSREWAHRPRWGRLKEFPDAGPRNSACKGRAVSALFAPPTSARVFVGTRGAREPPRGESADRARREPWPWLPPPAD